MSHVALVLLHVYVALHGGAEEGAAAEAAEAEAFAAFVGLNAALPTDFYVPQVVYYCYSISIRTRIRIRIALQ